MTEQYVCDYCGEIFDSPVNCMEHEATHDESADKWALKWAGTVHTNHVLGHVCTVCGYGIPAHIRGRR